MDELEFTARQEFARILTKVMHMNTLLLDGRPWGRVTPDEFSGEQFGERYLRLDYAGWGLVISMHASDNAVFSRSIARVWDTTVTEKGSLAYALVVRERTT